MSAVVYYSDGPRMLQVSRCGRYWSIWSRAWGPGLEGLHGVDSREARNMLQAHMAACSQCRAWLEAVAGAGKKEVIEVKSSDAGHLVPVL